MAQSPGPGFTDAVRKEAERIRESAVYSAQGQFEAAKRWRWRHWSGGVLAAGLGTGGAILTFAECSPVLAGAVTLGGAVTAAAMTGVRPDQLAERAQASGNEYTSLRNAARRFIDVDAQSLPHDEVRAALEELAGRADGLDRAADPIPRWAYERAKKNIAAGGQDFEADRP